VLRSPWTREAGTGLSRARDNPESIETGSQAGGSPVIPLDEDLELIGVEDGPAPGDAQAQPLDPLPSPGNPLGRSALVARVLRSLLDFASRSHARYMPPGTRPKRVFTNFLQTQLEGANAPGVRR
jgi:hypothetical protein